MEKFGFGVIYSFLLFQTLTAVPIELFKQDDLVTTQSSMNEIQSASHQTQQPPPASAITVADVSVAQQPSSFYSYLTIPYWSRFSESAKKAMDTYSPFVKSGIDQSLYVGNDVLSKIYNTGADSVKAAGQYGLQGLALGVGASMLMAQKSKDMLGNGANYVSDSVGATNSYIKQELINKMNNAADAIKNIGEARRNVMASIGTMGQSGVKKTNDLFDSMNNYWVGQLQYYSSQLAPTKMLEEANGQIDQLGNKMQELTPSQMMANFNGHIEQLTPSQMLINANGGISQMKDWDGQIVVDALGNMVNIGNSLPITGGVDSITSGLQGYTDQLIPSQMMADAKGQMGDLTDQLTPSQMMVDANRGVDQMKDWGQQGLMDAQVNMVDMVEGVNEHGLEGLPGQITPPSSQQVMADVKIMEGAIEDGVEGLPVESTLPSPQQMMADVKLMEGKIEDGVEALPGESTLLSPQQMMADVNDGIEEMQNLHGQVVMDSPGHVVDVMEANGNNIETTSSTVHTSSSSDLNITTSNDAVEVTEDATHL